MVRVADEAPVGEHDVVADLDPLVRGEHHAAVEEAPLADLDRRLARHRDPAPRLEQRPLPDPQASLIEALEQLALDGEADVEAAARCVTVDPPAPAPRRVALVPAALEPPGAPSRRVRHRRKPRSKATGRETR